MSVVQDMAMQAFLRNASVAISKAVAAAEGARNGLRPVKSSTPRVSMGPSGKCYSIPGYEIYHWPGDQGADTNAFIGQEVLDSLPLEDAAVLKEARITSSGGFPFGIEVPNSMQQIVTDLLTKKGFSEVEDELATPGKHYRVYKEQDGKTSFMLPDDGLKQLQQALTGRGISEKKSA